MKKYFRYFFDLKSYVELNDYKGWDPYDGLKSKFFKMTPISKIPFFEYFGLSLLKNFL